MRRTIAASIFPHPAISFRRPDMPALMRWMAEEAARAGATLMYGKKFEGGLGV
jgi:hypothetical protein